MEKRRKEEKRKTKKKRRYELDGCAATVIMVFLCQFAFPSLVRSTFWTILAVHFAPRLFSRAHPISGLWPFPSFIFHIRHVVLARGVSVPRGTAAARDHLYLLVRSYMEGRSSSVSLNKKNWPFFLFSMKPYVLFGARARHTSKTGTSRLRPIVCAAPTTTT